MSESGVGYLDVILDISILCYSFRFKMQWLAVIVNAIVKFIVVQLSRQKSKLFIMN